MTQLWSLIILALHVALPTGLPRDTFQLRAVVQNQPVLEATISRDGSGRFMLRSPSEFLPAVIEQSRIHSQVYTIFTPWQPDSTSIFALDSDPSLQSDLGTGLGQDRVHGLSEVELEQPQAPQYAAGSFPPVTVDLTPILLQNSLTRQGRFTLRWPLSPTGDVEIPAPLTGSNSQLDDPSQDLEINILLSARDLSIFAPGVGIMIQATFP